MKIGNIMSEVTDASGSKWKLQLEFLARLGSGKAAEANLVRDASTGTLYVEKAFKTEVGLSRLIRDVAYRVCFQAPYPYEVNASAVYAALFRRKVLRELTELWFDRPVVADACYTRWDEERRVNVLGTEYITGFGPKPGEVNCSGIRHLLHNYPVRLYRMATRSQFEKHRGPAWEIEETINQMDKLKDKFRQAGFLGMEWQVEKRVSASTSNLLKNGNGDWILVDLESGFPALPLPRYVWPSIRSGSIPLFDDIDFTKLHSHLEDNLAQLVAKLGDERIRRLYEYVGQLEHHTEGWKTSEPAIFRHRHRLIIHSQLRSNIRRGFIEYWLRSGKISAERAEQLAESNLSLLAYYGFDLTRGIYSAFATFARSVRNLGASIAKGAGKAVRVFYSSFFDEKYLREVARTYVNSEVDSWQKSGRLTEQEASKLRENMETPDAVEYMQGFVAHVSLQALAPPFLGEVALVWLAVYLGSPAPLAGFLISPLLRTSYTLYRKIKNRGKGISYSYAFLVGAMPRVGAGAYIAQMFLTCPSLSLFLARSQAAQAGSWVPLFGGENSRIEHFFIRTINIFASIQYELINIINGIRAMPVAPSALHRIRYGVRYLPWKHGDSRKPRQTDLPHGQGVTEEERGTRDKAAA